MTNIVFIRLPQVIARVGLSPMTLWRREHKNPPTFPRRVKLGPNSVAWPEDEIEGWCAARLAERDQNTGPDAPRAADPKGSNGAGRR